MSIPAGISLTLDFARSSSGAAAFQQQRETHASELRPEEPTHSLPRARPHSARAPRRTRCPRLRPSRRAETPSGATHPDTRPRRPPTLRVNLARLRTPHRSPHHRLRTYVLRAPSQSLSFCSLARANPQAPALDQFIRTNVLSRSTAPLARRGHRLPRSRQLFPLDRATPAHLRALTKSDLRRIEQFDPSSLQSSPARRDPRSRKPKRRRKSLGKYRGPLHGIPWGGKIFWIPRYPTTTEPNLSAIAFPNTTPPSSAPHTPRLAVSSPSSA